MILTVKDLSVSFGGRLILEGFNLELAEGDHSALTGRSGSGKTTLLLLLAGLLAPTSGTIERHVAPRDVIYVPQAPSLVPELSAVQNASLGLRIRGVDPAQAEARGRDQLQALGLSDVDDALPAELSGGMQQRVALARALAIGARLLLVDEPTGALDRATGDDVIEVLRATDSTVIVATHDPDVAARFPRRLVIDKELVR
jgi:ABC-type nitrate/sulfonate/bicarbonate transport system ATPase subunit